MTQARQLYRSRDALIGGVCAGVADYLNLDAVLVRILVVVLTLASAGLLGIAYAALWVVVPKAPPVVMPLDVEPEAVRSDTYGTVDYESFRKDDKTSSHRGNAAQAASQRYVTSTPYVGAAHVPPEPPAAAAWGGPPPNYTAMPPIPQQPASAPAYTGWSYASHPEPTSQSKKSATAKAKAAMWIGSFLLFFGIVAAVATLIEDIAWWQYWPLLFMILGIVQMVIPGTAGHRMRTFVGGGICFCIGATLILMSLQVVAWQSLEFMFVGLWPLLLMMVGFFVLGTALKSPVLILFGGFCFAAFCLVGLAWYAMPGTTDEIVLSVPYGRDYHFNMIFERLLR